MGSQVKVPSVNQALLAVTAGVLAKAPVSSPSFGSKEDSLCVLMDLCGGVWSYGLGSAEKTTQSYCWTGFDAHTKIFNSVNSICFLSLLLSPPVYKVMILLAVCPLL